ncbi:MAG: hypothetical protein EHM23_14870 [Acidobacteria bacterium]|nr:MAG: hypothetical protein EHM23_14870 [Acidobacteriota bacterium]
MADLRAHENHIPVYQQTVDQVLADLQTEGRQGLHEAEASARLERYGRNELTPEKPTPGWRMLRYNQQRSVKGQKSLKPSLSTSTG